MTTDLAVSPETLEELKRRLYESLPDPVIIGDVNRRIILANEQAVVLFEYPGLKELLGQKVAALVPPELMTEEQHDGFYDSFLGGARSRTMGTESPLTAKTYFDNRIPVGLKLFVIVVGDERFVGEIIRDRSIQVDQEARIREQRFEIQTKNKQLKTSLRNEQAAKNKVELTLKRNQLQRDIIFGIIALSLFLYVLPFILLLAGIRIPDGLISLSRDSTILILSTLAGAIAGITGYSKGEKDSVSAKRVEDLEVQSEIDDLKD